ncbi:MAG: acyltransferase family protein [Casimicrobium sp.]
MSAQTHATHLGYLAHVDGLRALAVLAVIVYHLHAAWLPGGFAGVDVFFVISGYVVTASLASRAHESIGRFIAGFYVRRLIRVAPALVVMLLVTVLACVLFVPPGWLSGFNEKTALYAFFGLSNILLAQNTEAYFAPRTEYNASTHTWSLGVEEQFYLVVPILLFGWFSLRLRGSRRAVLFAALIVTLAIASLVFARWAQANAPLHAFYSLASRFWELAIGVLLALFTHTRNAQVNTHKSIIAANFTGFVGLGLLIASYVYTPIAQFPWPYAVLAVAASALLIGVAGVESPRDVVRNVLASRVLVAIGLRSYSLYLWHWPVFVLMRWTVGLGSVAQQALAITLTFFFAECSYRLVERPIRESAWLRARSVWLQLVLLISLVIGAAMVAHLLFDSRAKLTQSTVVRNAADWYAGDRMSGMDASRHCQVELRHRAIQGSNVVEYHPRDCKRAPLEMRLFVLGDSHAGAYLMMFDQFAAETGAVVRVYHVPGCEFLGLNVPMLEIYGGICAAPTKAALQDASALFKEGDVAFLPSLRVNRFSDQWMRFDERAARERMSGEVALATRARAVAEAKEWLVTFTEKRMHVLFEYPKPIFRSPPFRCSDHFNRTNEVCSGGLTIEREDFLNYRRPVVEAMDSLSRWNTLVSAWDPLPTLCPDALCSALRGVTPLYYDGDHVSAAGNRWLYPSFKEAICKLSPFGRCEP